jgi:peptidoglycan/xylan/chitin deacetylase (PgdA/CDA1 family)
MLFLVLGLVAGAGPAAAGDPAGAEGISILAYHRFDPTTPASTTVTTANFEQQLSWLAAHHYRIVTLRAVADALSGSGPAIHGPAVAICADDGHRSVYTQMYPIIKREHIPVTLFIYPSAISHASYALTWEQLREMEQSGLVDVQSHTYWHPNFNHERAQRDAADYQRFVDFQLTRSRKVLEQRLGHPVDLLAWPYGIYDAALEAAAAKAGYRAAFALDGRSLGAATDLFAIPRYMMAEHDRGARFAAMVGDQSKKGS